jgi:hypothetical protein
LLEGEGLGARPPLHSEPRAGIVAHAWCPARPAGGAQLTQQPAETLFLVVSGHDKERNAWALRSIGWVSPAPPTACCPRGPRGFWGRRGAGCRAPPPPARAPAGHTGALCKRARRRRPLTGCCTSTSDVLSCGGAQLWG